ncbi:MAG: hypothetical protein AABZ47_10200 [Planctomycetota bacterium]
MALGLGLTGGIFGVVLFKGLGVVTQAGVGAWTTVVGILLVVWVALKLHGMKPIRGDEAMQSLATIVMLFLAGAAVFGGRLFVALARWGHTVALENFVWSDGPAALLYVGLGCIGAAIPFGLMGLATVFLCRISRPKARWDMVMLGVVFLGVSIGIVLARRALRAGCSLDVVRLVAGLPALLSCLVGAWCWPATQASARNEHGKTLSPHPGTA